jgi:acyl-CoA synthetase (AMP-forming)/AMP-acid ligase II
MTKQNFNIVDLFFDAAKKSPDRIAVIDKKKQITFFELERQVKHTANYFLKKGIQRGDRILVFVPMCIDLYRIVLALFKIGAAAVFLDEWVSKKRMEECCKVAQCKAFIGIPKARLLSLFSSELRKIPIHLGTKYISGIKNNLRKASVQSGETALITFTTGSTGIPKAANRTHGFLREQFKVLVEKINPQPGEVSIPALPVVLLINLGAGCTSLITDFKAGKPELMDANKILNQINFYKVRTIVASPFFIKELAKRAIIETIKLPTLKKVFTGGAPVFPSEAKIYKQAFPVTDIEIVYGSTEAEPISSINVETLIEEHSLTNGLNVGKPDRNAQVKIIQLYDGNIECADEIAFQKLVLPEGVIGEIVVSGPHVLDAYFNNETALKRNKIFVESQCWHRTGDSGFTVDGNLFLTGRCNALILWDNKIISPFLYEGYFQTIPGIEMGTLLKKENGIIAVIETTPKANKKEILARFKNLKDSLVPFATIEWISKMPSDPRHHSKIDYEKLRASI